MANTQISITANGTKTLATAGKYCDKNIDVNVDVPGEATRFTNLYDPANVVLQMVSNCSASAGATQTTDKQVNYLVIQYHHMANDPVVLRMRGISTVRDRMNLPVFNADGTTPKTWGQISASTISYDEYGDVMLTLPNTFKVNEWYYLHLNFQYPAVNSSVATAYDGPIITINEPIGNGGHAV